MLLKAALLDSLSEIQEVSMEVRYSIKCLYFLLCFTHIVYLPTKLNCSSNLGYRDPACLCAGSLKPLFSLNHFVKMNSQRKISHS